jgi:hypothetical protein
MQPFLPKRATGHIDSFADKQTGDQGKFEKIPPIARFSAGA